MPGAQGTALGTHYAIDHERLDGNPSRVAGGLTSGE